MLFRSVWRNIDLGTELGPWPWSSESLLWSRETWDPLRRSLWLGVVVSLSSAVIGTGLAWLSMRTDMPLARLIRFVAPMPLVLPSFVAGAALLAAFAPGGLLEEVLAPLGVERLPSVRGLLGSVVALTVISYPYVFLPVAARLRQLPASVEEAARLLGAPPRRVFRLVVWPQIAGSVRAGALLGALYSMSDFEIGRAHV